MYLLTEDDLEQIGNYCRERDAANSEASNLATDTVTELVSNIRYAF